ncbi:MAG: carboxypeptidase-like regulatory domain-containing protein [Pyrinomonadaceae bacterium]
MKRSIIFLLIVATTTYGQQRNTRLDASLPPPGSAGTVTLSLAEYNRLVELATKKPTAPNAAPLPFVLSRAVFNLRVEDQLLRGTVEIEGTSLEKGSVKIPLSAGLTVLDASQSNKFLPMSREGDVHSGIISSSGAFSVKLNVASEIASEGGRASFALPVPASGSSLMTLDLPGNHANVGVEPGLITDRKSEQGHTIIDATLEPGKTARVWWTTREIAAPLAQREIRFLSDIKSVVSVGDSQVRVAALCDINVVQGEAAEFKVPLPAGFDLTDVTGSTLESSEIDNSVLTLRVREPSRRNHQFLIAIERTNQKTKVDAPLFSFNGAQRETGELLIEGIGTMDLTATESGALRRMDVREATAIAKSLSRFPLQAAFRYNRHQGDTSKLELEWTQFPDSAVLSAVAERATVTTLTNVEGKSLTEVALRVRNHAQPFVKVELPAGAQLLSAEVEGERVKPVVGPDGSRVPLLRAGLNSSGTYTVSFVYLSSGVRFSKAGAYEMGLPKVDIPISLLTWEVSLPARLQIKQFGGNALAAELFPSTAQNFSLDGVDDFDAAVDPSAVTTDIGSLENGQMGGIVVDPMGAVVPRAVITVVNKQTGSITTVQSNDEGRWIATGVQSGPVTVTIDSPGFAKLEHDFAYVTTHPARIGSTLQVATVTETVQVTAGITSLENENRIVEDQVRKSQLFLLTTPSQNVMNLQRRVAGILPVHIDVPQSGRSYRFIRPLVLDEETKISFQYKTK